MKEMIRHEQHLDGVLAWSGLGTTSLLWLSSANTLLVFISAVVTVTFTLRRWYLMEQKRKNNKEH